MFVLVSSDPREVTLKLMLFSALIKKNKQISEPRKATRSVETPPSAGETRLVRVTQSLIKEGGGWEWRGRACVSPKLWLELATAQIS